MLRQRYTPSSSASSVPSTSCSRPAPGRKRGSVRVEAEDRPVPHPHPRELSGSAPPPQAGLPGPDRRPERERADEPGGSLQGQSSRDTVKRANVGCLWEEYRHEPQASAISSRSSIGSRNPRYRHCWRVSPELYGPAGECCRSGIRAIRCEHRRAYGKGGRQLRATGHRARSDRSARRLPLDVGSGDLPATARSIKHRLESPAAAPGPTCRPPPSRRRSAF
jgi:hypothetical protein